MSLLLDALKKAELAKQIAKAESPTPAPAGTESAPPDTARRVITREKLPDITQPLEILTDDLPSSSEQKSEPASARQDLSLEPPPFEPALQPPVSMNEPAQAEQLFQVNEMEYNPRRP